MTLHKEVYVPDKNYVQSGYLKSDKISVMIEQTDMLSSGGHIPKGCACSFREIYKDAISTDFLQQKTNVYLLTPEELLELKKKWAAEAFDKGAWEEQDGHNAIHGSRPKTEYINNLTIE